SKMDPADQREFFKGLRTIQTMLNRELTINAMEYSGKGEVKRGKEALTKGLEINRLTTAVREGNPVATFVRHFVSPPVAGKKGWDVKFTFSDGNEYRWQDFSGEGALEQVEELRKMVTPRDENLATGVEDRVNQLEHAVEIH